MNEFWDFTFDDTAEFIETFDELPLWSAPFGLLLLKHIALKPGQTVLDLGSGAGFPLFELAERLGDSCRCYGLDPWKNATDRAKKKIGNYAVTNVEVLEGSADDIPFDRESIDLIVSNLGVNNFDNREKVLKECHRVLKSNGKFVVTTNLDGHWKEFYDVFEQTLQDLDLHELIPALSEHQRHRGTVAGIAGLFDGNGFEINRVFEETFEIRFLNGSAFLRHHFIKVGWLLSWKGLIPKHHWAPVFKKLEENLNILAEKSGELRLTVPMAFIEVAKAEYKG